MHPLTSHRTMHYRRLANLLSYLSDNQDVPTGATYIVVLILYLQSTLAVHTCSHLCPCVMQPRDLNIGHPQCRGKKNLLSLWLSFSHISWANARPHSLCGIVIHDPSTTNSLVIRPHLAAQPHVLPTMSLFHSLAIIPEDRFLSSFCLPEAFSARVVLLVGHFRAKCVLQVVEQHTICTVM